MNKQSLPLESPEALQERLLAALHASETGTWKWDIAEDRVQWDEPLARVYGLDFAHAPKTAGDFLALVHPDDRQRVWAVVERSLKQQIDPDHEFRIVRPDGSVRWIYDRSRVIRDAAGKPLYIIGACLDITKRKRFEHALLDSETRLELATNAAGLGIWDWDLRTNGMVYSERAKAIYGFALHDAVTFDKVRSATHPEDLPRTSGMAKRALDPAVREREPYEYRVIHPDGSVRWVLAHGFAVFEQVEGADRAVRYVGTIQDITDRRQTEKALRDSESRLRLAIDAGHMAIWEYDVAADAVIGSPELNRLLGFPEDAMPSLQELRAGYYPGEEGRVRAAGAEALARGDKFFEVEYRYRRLDSSLRWLLLRAEIVLTAAGAPERVIGVVLDITEQKRAVERQQLLINELNHRVKNTLTTVQSITAQTLRHATKVAHAQADIERRLVALSQAHDLLTEQGWEKARIAAVVDRAILPFLTGPLRVHAKGTDAWLNPKSALDLAMALQELVTNAMKYGALSNATGKVAIAWEIESRETDDVLRLQWRESGGPAVRPPKRKGFGSRLIRTLAADAGGEASLEFNGAGLNCSLTFLLPRREIAEKER